LIGIYQTLPEGKKQMTLQPLHVKRLKALLSTITRDALDVTLLDPLPRLDKLPFRPPGEQ
jgi:hypothetical protein